MRRRKSAAEDRLFMTIQKPDGAVVARIDSMSETGVTALLNGELSEDGRYPFTLHLSGRTVAGEVEDAGTAGDLRRLRFVALTGSDLRLLEPYFSQDQ